MVKKLWKVLRKRIAKNKSRKIWNSKSTQKKIDKLYVKWKGFDNRFNSWIDKNDLMSQYFPKPLRTFG